MVYFRPFLRRKFDYVPNYKRILNVNQVKRKESNDLATGKAFRFLQVLKINRDCKFSRPGSLVLLGQLSLLISCKLNSCAIWI